ncbi:MAG: molybdopterin dinucleotide binding domain-containing protein, partial [Rhodoferax sp.]
RRLLKEGDLVHVTSKRGSILVPVQASADLGMSQVFMAMHWGEEFLSGISSTGQRLAGVNALTTPAYCPDSKQPEFKHAAVKVLKADMPWSLLAVAWLPADRVLSVRAELQQLMSHFAYASCVPFTNNVPLDAPDQERSGLLFRATTFEIPADDALLAQIEALLNLDKPQVVRYADKKRGQRRAALLQRTATKTTLEGFMLAGDTSAQGWITTLLQDELPAQAYSRVILVPGAKPPVQVVSRGKQVCACFNVTDVAIDAQLATSHGSAKERLNSLQSALKCGTNCGSCLPQLQRMVRASLAPSLQSA